MPLAAKAAGKQHLPRCAAQFLPSAHKALTVPPQPGDVVRLSGQVPAPASSVSVLGSGCSAERHSALVLCREADQNISELASAALWNQERLWHVSASLKGCLLQVSLLEESLQQRQNH